VYWCLSVDFLASDVLGDDDERSAAAMSFTVHNARFAFLVACLYNCLVRNGIVGSWRHQSDVVRK